MQISEFDERELENMDVEEPEKEDLLKYYRFDNGLITEQRISAQTKKRQISQVIMREILDDLKKIVKS